MRLVLAISLLLNLMLGLRVLTRQALENDSAPTHPLSLNVRTGNLNSAHRAASPRKEPSAEAPSDGNSTLDWRTIESADYPVYVARLRSANVPEDLVRELVIADVRKAFSPRAHAILGTNEHTRYWQKPQYEPRSSEQLRQLRDLEKEEQDVLAQVLGIQTTIQPLVDRLYLQIDPREVALGGFPSEVQEAAKRTLEHAGIRHDEVNDPSLAEGAEDPVDLNRIQRRLDVLAGILSKEELEEYRARISPLTGGLARQVRPMDLTEAEFLKLLEVRMNDSKLEESERKRVESETAVGILGDERATEFQRSLDWTYLYAREAVQHYGLQPDAANEVYELKRSSIQAALEIHTSTVSEAEKKRRLRSIREQAIRQIRAKLGEPGSALVFRVVSPWLDFLEYPEVLKP